MKVVRSPAGMSRLALQWRASGVKVALVPTMGALHDGHLSLVARARRLAGPKGAVVVSVFVNPTQFGANEDFSAYPRDLAADRAKCVAAGVDALFAPSDTEMYPRKKGLPYSAFVTEEALSLTMEGAARPTHFRGVTTVVAKLFNLTLPHHAVFGAKDFQQASIIGKMARDLNFPVKVIVAPTFREPDGLAMSSRNRYLTPEERSQATILRRVVLKARSLVKSGPVPVADLKAQLGAMVASEPLARLDYVEIFDPRTLQPLAGGRKGARLALAVFFGKTRLIDNDVL